MNLIRPAQFASWRVWLLAMALLFWLRTKINCRKKSFEITKLVHIKTWYGVSVKGEGIFPLTNQFSKPGTPVVTFDFRTNSFPISFWLTYNHFSLIYEKPSKTKAKLQASLEWTKSAKISTRQTLLPLITAQSRLKPKKDFSSFQP